jgi:cytochrome c peroxidase
VLPRNAYPASRSRRPTPTLGAEQALAAHPDSRTFSRGERESRVRNEPHRQADETMSTALRTAQPILLLLSTLAAASCRDVSPVASAPPEVPVPMMVLAAGVGLPPFDEAMAELGDAIFDDLNLSIGRNQACNSCHSADWGFTGPDPTINAGGAVYPGSIAGAFGDRKPPSSAYSTLSPVLHLSRKAGGLFVGGNFFDGRATGERLGSPAAEQAQGPFLNPVEHALPDAACVVYRIREEASYLDDYLAIWGDNILTIQFPDAAQMERVCTTRPATVALSAADRAKVQQEYDKIAISIAMYEESHNLFSSKFDASRKGLYTLTSQEQRGFALFQGKARCAKCHTSSGQQPAFTDHTYDNLGVPRNPENPIYRVDPGFVDHGLGGFLATRTGWQSFAAAERGKMRVPTLRNVDLRPYEGAVKAYMHNGVFKSLEEVVRFYNTRDVLPRCAPDTPRTAWGASCWPAPEVAENMNTSELGDLGLSPDEETALVAFLRTLSDGFVPGGRGRHLNRMR